MHIKHIWFYSFSVSFQLNLHSVFSIDIDFGTIFCIHTHFVITTYQQQLYKSYFPNKDETHVLRFSINVSLEISFNSFYVDAWQCKHMPHKLTHTHIEHWTSFEIGKFSLFSHIVLLCVCWWLNGPTSTKIKINFILFFFFTKFHHTHQKIKKEFIVSHYHWKSI